MEPLYLHTLSDLHNCHGSMDTYRKCHLRLHLPVAHSVMLLDAPLDALMKTRIAGES